MKINSIRLEMLFVVFRPRSGFRALLAIVCSLFLTGCQDVEHAGALVSRIKCPVTVNIPSVNRGADPANNRAIDEFEDLTNRSTLFMICISGGGARAARMGLYAMSIIESNYNSRASAETKNFVPLIDKIDAISTVSGGSIYASWIAKYEQARIRMIESSSKAGTNNVSEFKTRIQEPFELMTYNRSLDWDTKELGAISSISYLSPGNLFCEPILEFFTEWDTLNQFADTHETLQRKYVLFLPHEHLDKLPVKPRFYFNSTCLESGRPFVFTRSILHAKQKLEPGDPLGNWIAGRWNADGDDLMPFAVTLEDMGSAPDQFPIAYAVLASAAFPGIFQPLPIQVYGRYGNSETGRRYIHLVDGGVYDNTGMTTALTLFDYIRQRSPKPKKLVLLSIDANNIYEYSDSEKKVTKSPLHF